MIFHFNAVAPKNTTPLGAFIRVDTPSIVTPIISSRSLCNSVSSSSKQPSNRIRVYPENSPVMFGTQLQLITLRCICWGERSSKTSKPSSFNQTNLLSRFAPQGASLKKLGLEHIAANSFNTPSIKLLLALRSFLDNFIFTPSNSCTNFRKL